MRPYHSARPRDDDDYDDLPRRPKKKQGMSVGMILLIVFGSIGAVSCLVCAGASIAGYFVYVKAAEAMDDMNAALPAGKGKVVLSEKARLMPNDPQRQFDNGFMKENKPHKSFQVALEQGKTYVITLASTEMDSFLYVFDPNGRLLAFDDDSGGGITGLNSRIHLTPNQAGNYLIACTALGGPPAGGASFTVSVRER